MLGALRMLTPSPGAAISDLPSGTELLDKIAELPDINFDLTSDGHYMYTAGVGPGRMVVYNFVSRASRAAGLDHIHDERDRVVVIVKRWLADMLPKGVPRCPTYTAGIARGSAGLQSDEHVPANARFLTEHGGLQNPPSDGEQKNIKKYLDHCADVVPSDQGLPPVPPELDSDFELQALRIWLGQTKLKLTAYEKGLVDLGVTHPEHTVDLDEENFQTLGMKPLEIKRLRKQIKKEFSADVA